MTVTWLDKTLRFDRKKAGGRYIRFVWWRGINWGWLPKTGGGRLRCGMVVDTDPRPVVAGNQPQALQLGIAMARVNVKCEDCHRRRKITLVGMAQMKAEAQLVGCRVGVLCPDCILKAYEDEAAYTYSISDGEMLLDVIGGKPPWRMVHLPE